MITSKKSILTLGLLILTILSTACGTGPQPAPTTSSNLLTIDPVLRAFYSYLGGEDRLGRPISLSRVEGVTTVQYVSAGKMVYDPTAPATSHFSMAPLGVQMELSEPPIAPPINSAMLYYGGHVIHPDFAPLVTELGLDTVGLPLTEGKHNLVRNRWEQYFANLGMYRLDGSSEVRLLAYGEWVCKDDCLFIEEGVLNAAPEDDIDTLGGKAVDAMFVDLVTQYGTDLTGFGLDPAGVAADGKWEQIFENVVLVTETRLGPGDVSLRPLSDILNITPDPPTVYSGDPNMYFLATQQGADLGYDIPVYFWEYIQNNGGLALVGQPITHLTLLMGAVYHQCFQNLCLAYEPGAVDNAHIRPEPLGYAYKSLYGSAGGPSLQPTAIPTLTIAPTRSPLEVTVEATPVAPVEVAPTAVPPTQAPLHFAATSTTPPTAAPTLPPAAAPAVGPSTPPAAAVREITIQVLERSKAIGAQTAPEFGAFLWENGSPVSGAALDVTVVMPDGATRIFFMPLTDANGYTTLLLPVMEGPPSTVVPYKVCYTALADLRVCVYDYFVIWTTP